MGPCFRGDAAEFCATYARTANRRSEKSRPGAAIIAQRLRRVESCDGLDLEIFFQAVFAPLTAVPGLLVAAERRGAVVGHALQVDVAGANPAADPAGALHRGGGDA